MDEECFLSSLRAFPATSYPLFYCNSDSRKVVEDYSITTPKCTGDVHVCFQMYLSSTCQSSTEHTTRPGSLVLVGLLKFASHLPFYSCWVLGLPVYNSLLPYVSCNFWIVKHRIVDPCSIRSGYYKCFSCRYYYYANHVNFAKNMAIFRCFGFVCPLSIELLLGVCFH